MTYKGYKYHGPTIDQVAYMGARYCDCGAMFHQDDGALIDGLWTCPECAYEQGWRYCAYCGIWRPVSEMYSRLEYGDINWYCRNRCS